MAGVEVVAVDREEERWRRPRRRRLGLAAAVLDIGEEEPDSMTKTSADGVVLAPSVLVITVGLPPSMTATHEFVVPKSIPIILLISFSSCI